MSAFHLRHGWISRQRLAACFPGSPALTALRELLARRPPPGLPGTFRDLETVRAWVRCPRLPDAPTGKILKGARAGASSPEDQTMLAWATAVVAAIRDAEAAPAVPHAEISDFLVALASTDFPLNLLVSRPELAPRMFGPDGTRLTDEYREPGRRTTRACLTCLGYALGGVGRMSPRDAWIGLAFGVFTASAPPLGITSTHLRIDPDLGWIDRHWRLSTCPLGQGLTPWEYLERRSDGDPVYAPVLAQLRGLLQRFHATAPAFAILLQFLGDADTLLRSTVDEATWQADPHRFWFTRVHPGELTLPVAARTQLLALLTIRRETLDPRAADDASIPRVPYPLRVQATRPAAVHLRASELFDWIVTPGDPPPRFAAALPPGSAAVVSLDETGARLDYVDPNPRRAGDRFAVGLTDRPAFCDDPEDRRFCGLRPPPHLVDNRLVRLADASAEAEPATTRPGDPVLLYTPLLTRDTAPLLALEVASPRYTLASDILPRSFDPDTAATVSVGRVCPKSQTWLLTPDYLAALHRRVKRADTLAALYHLEVAPLLGAPAWLTALLGGKRTVLHTPSLLCWFYLLHELRETRGPVALLHEHTSATAPLVVDAHGHSLPVQILLR